MRRLPRYITGHHAPTSEDEADGFELLFGETVDLRGGDTVVFPNGGVYTVNGSEPVELTGGKIGWRVVLGEDPRRKPRKHSGKAPPLFKADGVTPYSSEPSKDEEGES